MQSVYLDVAIGLALAFFLLSLVPGALNEAFTWMFRVRAKFLWAFLRDLLDGPSSSTDESGPAQKRLPDSVVDVLLRLPMSRLQDARPTYDGGPAPTSRVVEGTKTAATVGVTDAVHARLAWIDVPSSPRATKHTTIRHIPPKRFATALLDVMMETNPDNPRSAVDEWIKGLEASPARERLGLRASPARGPLLTLWRSTNGDLERFRAGVAEWFDGEMHRLSDLYRRQTRWVLAILAPVVAVALSVDAMELGQNLWTNADLRTSLVSATSRDDQELNRIYDQCREGSQRPDAVGEFERVRDCVNNDLARLNALNLTQHAVFVDPTRWSGRLTFGHLVGMIVTAFAIWFGSPFWYDLLRRLTGVRPSRADTDGS